MDGNPPSDSSRVLEDRPPLTLDRPLHYHTVISEVYQRPGFTASQWPLTPGAGGGRRFARTLTRIHLPVLRSDIPIVRVTSLSPNPLGAQQRLH